MSDSTGLGYLENYPTPSTMSEDWEATSPPQASEAPKKKRKAWGQPVPEINPILPPRKRAKTAEEKEQRKNERILRNRRAADKSRQRQKAAVAELEVKTGRIEQENAMLRDMLAKYQARFGVPNDLQVTIPPPSESDYQTAPSHLDLDDETTSIPGSFPSPTLEPTTQHQPILVPTDSTPITKHDSPSLTPSLMNLDDQIPQTQESSLGNLTSTSVLTQYPAAVLCDLQCQTEAGSSRLSKLISQPISQAGLSSLFRAMLHLTIFQTYSTTMLSQMYLVFQILVQRLETSSVERIFPSLLTNFHLIRTLISMPATPKRPAVFRLKLLSRLLACSPIMARLLLAATDRDLQQVVSKEGFAENTDDRWAWASLMTIKWGILRLEREHRKIRYRVDIADRQVLERDTMPGVDFGAVARSSGLWRQKRDCINMDDLYRPTAPEVH